MFSEFENKKNVLLSNYSTVKIGGVANCIVFPKNYLEIKKILKIIKKNQLKYIFLGNGSNILFPDNYFSGIIISLKHFNRIKIDKNCVRVGAGVNLFYLNHKLADVGLTGLEWSYGIPASFGGFVFMNGGCFGHEVIEFIEDVVVLQNGTVKRLKKADLHFSYRNSNLKDCVILSAKIKLRNADKNYVLENMSYYYMMKQNSQPCDMPSLGSVFKRVMGEEVVYPAKLIDNLGLKGVKIGGAEVSQKHAGFIINSGNATAEDFRKLITLLREEMSKLGVFPELEIYVVEDEYEGGNSES